MHDADIDGSTLLHLAANSGVLKVIPCQAMNPQTWSFSVKKTPHSLISNLIRIFSYLKMTGLENLLPNPDLNHEIGIILGRCVLT